MTALCASIDMRLVGNGNGKEKEKDKAIACLKIQRLHKGTKRTNKQTT